MELKGGRGDAFGRGVFVSAGCVVFITLALFLTYRWWQIRSPLVVVVGTQQYRLRGAPMDQGEYEAFIMRVKEKGYQLHLGASEGATVGDFCGGFGSAAEGGHLTVSLVAERGLPVVEYRFPGGGMQSDFAYCPTRDGTEALFRSEPVAVTRPDGVKLIFEWLYVGKEGVRYGDKIYAVDEVMKVLTVAPEKRYFINAGERAAARDLLKLMALLRADSGDVMLILLDEDAARELGAP